MRDYTAIIAKRDYAIDGLYQVMVRAETRTEAVEKAKEIARENGDWHYSHELAAVFVSATGYVDSETVDEGHEKLY